MQTLGSALSTQLVHLFCFVFFYFIQFFNRYLTGFTRKISYPGPFLFVHLVVP